MEITLYSFNKRNNSTKRPMGGTLVNGEIKETSSILTPTISFGAVQPEYNYAYIHSFSRYYWIRDWTYSGGLWVASMEVDVLASWKDVIGASRQFIVRSSAEYDPDIIDSMYPATNTAVTNVQTLDFGFDPDNPDFIIGVMGKGSDFGAITYYYMSAAQFSTLGDYLLGEVDYLGTDFGDLTADMIKIDFNPLQYIVTAYAVPLFPFGPFPTKDINFGWWTLGLSASIAPSNVHINRSIPIPKHPQAETRGQYLNGPPYSSYTAIIPPLGMVPLDSNVLAGAENLDIKYVVDLRANSVIVTMTANGAIVHQASAQYGAPVQLGQVGTSKLEQVGSALGVASSIFTGDVAGAIGGAVDAMKSVFPQAQTAGSNGSLGAYKTNPTLYAKFMEITEEDNSNIGRPLYKPRTISSIPGYVQTRNADIAAPATAEEIGRIENELNGGIFYE